MFTQHTHIVAVKTTGNVYCYEVGRQSRGSDTHPIGTPSRPDDKAVLVAGCRGTQHQAKELEGEDASTTAVRPRPIPLPPLLTRGCILQDLLTDERFTRKDIITIQDPLNIAAKELDVSKTDPCPP